MLAVPAPVKPIVHAAKIRTSPPTAGPSEWDLTPHDPPQPPVTPFHSLLSSSISYAIPRTCRCNVSCRVVGAARSEIEARALPNYLCCPCRREARRWVPGSPWGRRAWPWARRPGPRAAQTCRDSTCDAVRHRGTAREQKGRTGSAQQEPASKHYGYNNTCN